MTKLCPAQARIPLFTGLPWNLLPVKNTSCIWSHPSSASNAHFAAFCPQRVNSFPLNSMFFIAPAAYPTQRQLSNLQSTTEQLTGMRISTRWKPHFFAEASSGVSTENLRYLAFAGMSIGRYWKPVSAAMNFLSASYQHTVRNQLRPAHPWYPSSFEICRRFRSPERLRKSWKSLVNLRSSAATSPLEGSSPPDVHLPFTSARNVHRAPRSSLPMLLPPPYPVMSFTTTLLTTQRLHPPPNENPIGHSELCLEFA